MSGKASLSERAYWLTTAAPSGLSAVNGQTLNPYGPGVFDPSGSSTGSGVSVAANLAAVAVGTETLGSIISPSGWNSAVGIRPTLGLISRDGIIPITHSQDTAGPIARSVTDVAVLLGTLAGGGECFGRRLVAIIAPPRQARVGASFIELSLDAHPATILTTASCIHHAPV